MTQCPNCGAQQRRADACFCQNCGYPLPSSSPATAHTPAPPAGGGKQWLWVGGALLGVVIVILLFIFGSGQKIIPHKHAPVVIVTHTPLPATVSASAESSSPASPRPVPPTHTIAPTDTIPATTNTPVPVATATPRPTVTPRPSPAATPVPMALSSQVVWLRTGPGTEYQRVRKLASGETLTLKGRNASSSWLQITTDSGESGWVSGDFVDLGPVSLASLPILPAPPLPACQISVAAQFHSIYQRDRLGCAKNSPHVTWAAWEPFQGGAMLWRDDINAVTILYNGSGWQILPDQWHGEPTPSRGTTPPGMRQPVRGFGWIWGNHDDVFNGLGWATDEEKGVCLWVQDFQKGFIFVKSNDPYCNDRAGNSNYNRAAELPSLFIEAGDNGRSWRMY